MKNLTTKKEIKGLMAGIKELDKHFTWKLETLSPKRGKLIASFSWSYLSKEELLSLEIAHDSIYLMLPQTNFSGGILIGDRPWDDYLSIEEALPHAISLMVHTALETY